MLRTPCGGRPEAKLTSTSPHPNASFREPDWSSSTVTLGMPEYSAAAVATDCWRQIAKSGWPAAARLATKWRASQLVAPSTTSAGGVLLVAAIRPNRYRHAGQERHATCLTPTLLGLILSLRLTPLTKLSTSKATSLKPNCERLPVMPVNRGFISKKMSPVGLIRP